MYGGPVPALAELIANAWDADAHNVELRVPLDHPFTGSETIEIKDDGLGMSWEDVAGKYLVIGRNRRSRDKATTALGRAVMGRKGIGKLAGFGIARVVEVRTVRNKWLTHFAMDFDKMTSDSATHARYEPRILADERSNEPNSTTVTLRDLSLKRSIPANSFRDSLSRRFAIFDADFRLRINGKLIAKAEMPTLLRVPAKPGTVREEHVDGFGPVKYWYGFSRHTITEADARGLALMVRGRMARPPSMFDISGGVWNQQALEYLIGEIYADGLDDVEDFVSTDRQSINWSEDRPAALRTWAQALIKRAAREYADEKATLLRHEGLQLLDEVELVDIDKRLSALPPNIRTTADHLISSFAGAKDQLPSSSALANTSRAIIQLAEDAAGGTSHEGSALIYSLILERSKVIASAISSANAATRYNIVRSNPWLFVSPWRIAVEDKRLSRELKRLSSARASLSGFKLWAVQNETRWYLIGYGDDNARARQALTSVARDVEDSKHPLKIAYTILVTPSGTSHRTPNVRVTSIADVLSKAEDSCSSLLDLLTDG